MSRNLLADLSLLWPLVLVAAVVVAAFWVQYRQRRRRAEELTALASAQHVAFWYDQSPVAVPEISYGFFHQMGGTRHFLHGFRNGVEVFACDFRIGTGRGAHWATMVAVHGGLRDASRLNLDEWTLKPFQGWTFLHPSKSSGRQLAAQEIATLWDVMTAGVRA